MDAVIFMVAFSFRVVVVSWLGLGSSSGLFSSSALNSRSLLVSISALISWLAF